LALAELDPSLGGNPNDLLAYAATNTDFPANGMARLVFPSDNKRGRWNSNLDFVRVGNAVLEASTWALMLLGFGGLGFLRYRRSKTAVAARSKAPLQVFETAARRSLFCARAA
jgi:MYXO-CTERM domain-containing protein